MKNKITFILVALMLIVALPAFGQAWQDAPGAPTTCPAGTQGCQPPIDVSAVEQTKIGNFISLGELKGFTLLGNKGVFGSNYNLPATLSVGVKGNLGASAYCDDAGLNCKTIGQLGGTAPGGFTPPSCGTGEIMKWNGSAWACAADNGGAGGGGTVTSIRFQDGLTAYTSGGGVISNGVITSSGIVGLRKDCNSGEILKWQSGAWSCATDNGGGSGGDNLGNHTAQADLVMGSKRVGFNSGATIYGTGNDLNLEPLSPGKVSVVGPLSLNGDLSVGGTIKISGGGPVSGEVLTTDASGNGTWTDPISNLFSDAYYFKKSGTNTHDLNPSTGGTLRMCFLTAVDGPGTIACRLIPPTNPAPTDRAKYSPVGGGWKMTTNNANSCEAICFR